MVLVVHLYRPRRRFGYAGVLLSCLLFIGITAFVIAALCNTNRRADAEQMTQMANAIDRAVVTCYAIEGSYPPSLAYLEERYGVQVDREHYTIEYSVFGSNVRPTIQIIPKESIENNG